METTMAATEMAGGRIVILGYGPVGRATAERLVRQGRRVTVAQRSAPQDLIPGADFVRCDVLDAASVHAAAAGAAQVAAAFGFAYDGATWRQAWPRAMTNLIDACEAARARLVFFDNLYMYGPQSAPLTEDTPLSDYGTKPAVRSAVARLWMAARDAGRVKIATLRGPDFYGPGVGNSHLGDVGFGRLAKGKAATLIAPPDTPHDFAYAPDLGRMVATLLDAPDEDFGQVWHSPCAPTLTPREILALGAEAIGVKLRIAALPLGLLPILGRGSSVLREIAEMRFTFDRPYLVDAGKWKARFWSDVTPFEVGAPATARDFFERERSAAAAKAEARSAA
jgi:nucleoside-diphosphate-sugar epimerase